MAQPTGHDQSRRLTVEEVIRAIERDSPGCYALLAGYIPEHYPIYSNVIIDAFAKDLHVPTLYDGYEPTEDDARRISDALLCLTAVYGWYTANPAPSPLKTATATLLASSSTGVIFWSLRLLGAPATSDSPTAMPSWLREDGLKHYARVVALLHAFFDNPTTIFHRLMTHEAIFDLLVAIWVLNFNGQVPLYACLERSSDPTSNQEERVIKMVFTAVKANTRAFIQAVTAARICPPEVFVERTIRRMAMLSKLYAIPHLSHITSRTVENTNVGYIISITDALVHSEPYLRTLFTEAKAPRAYVEALLESMSICQLYFGRKMARAPKLGTDPGNDLRRLMRAVGQMTPHLGALVNWAMSTRGSTLSHVKDILVGGTIELLTDHFGILLTLPEVQRSPADAVWDMIEQHAIHLELIPVLCQRLGRSRFVFSSLDASLADDGRVEEVKGVAKRIIELGGFVKARATICDNLKHRQKTGGRVQTVKTCSRCHSVVYCSARCQRDDWAAFHRDECTGMAIDSLERSRADQCHTHRNRAFQATVLRHAYESSNDTEGSSGSPSLSPPSTPSVIKVDVLHPQNTKAEDIEVYVETTTPFIPKYLQPRFEAFISAVKGGSGSASAPQRKPVSQFSSARLLTHSFRLGGESVNMLLLLRRNRDLASKVSPTKRRQLPKTHSVIASDTSRFVIEGVMSFTRPAKALPDHNHDQMVSRLLDPYYNDRQDEMTALFNPAILPREKKKVLN